MYWTLELASKLEDAPWPATKEELIDYAMRSGSPMEVIENLQEIEDEGETYESIEDIWPDYPSKEYFLFYKNPLRTGDKKNFFCLAHWCFIGLNGVGCLAEISFFEDIEVLFQPSEVGLIVPDKARSEFSGWI